MTDASHPPEETPAQQHATPTPSARRKAAPKARGARSTAQKTTAGRTKRTKGAKDATTKRGRGRPRHEPTPEQIAKVEKLAQLGMDTQDIAWTIDFPISTFYDYLPSHFSEAIKRGKAKLKLNSGMVFVREMNKGNMTAAIWLEKTRLGITEKVHHVVPLPGAEGSAESPGPALAGVIAIGLFLPPNGRDLMPAGHGLHPSQQVAEVPPPVSDAPKAPVVGLALPSNNRDVSR